MYLPYTQTGETPSWDLVVRTKLPLATLVGELRDGLRGIDPDIPLTKARTMQSVVDRTLSSRRLLVWLVGGFAALALLLASLGLYGIISYGVNQRTKEIGIRMALGAEATTVQRQVVRETLRLAVTGLAAGLAGSFVAGRLMQSLLFGVAALDVATYLIAAPTRRTDWEKSSRSESTALPIIVHRIERTVRCRLVASRGEPRVAGEKIPRAVDGRHAGIGGACNREDLPVEFRRLRQVAREFGRPRRAGEGVQPVRAHAQLG
jgi:hypothetical protein